MVTRDKAYVYARLSLRGEDESSIKTQVERGIAEAQRRKLIPIVKVEEKGHRTGRSEKSRPVWRETKQLLTQPDAAALIVTEASRANRNVVDFLRLIDDLNKHGVTFVSLKEQHFTTDTAIGRLMMTVTAALNQFEAEQTSERRLDNIKHVRENKSVWLGSAPQGLKAIGKGNDRHLEISDETYTAPDGLTRRYIDTVIEYFKLLGTGVYSMDKSARELNARGYRWRNKKGTPKPIQVDNLDDLVISNYRGILDAALLNLAERRKNERKGFSRKHDPSPQSNTAPLLLWKVVFCVHCGEAYQVNTSHKQYRYYRHHKGIGCQSVKQVRDYKVHEQVWRLPPVMRLLNLTDEEIRALAERAALESSPDLSVETRKSLDAKRKRLLALYADGRFEKAELDSQVDAINAELATLPTQPPVRRSVHDYIALFSDMHRYLLTLSEQDPVTANMVFRDIFKKIYLDKGVIVKYELQDDFAQWIAIAL